MAAFVAKDCSVARTVQIRSAGGTDVVRAAAELCTDAAALLAGTVRRQVRPLAAAELRGGAGGGTAQTVSTLSCGHSVRATAVPGGIIKLAACEIVTETETPLNGMLLLFLLTVDGHVLSYSCEQSRLACSTVNFPM